MMSKKTVFGAVAVAAALACGGDALANCGTPKLFGTFDVDAGVYTYINFQAGGDPATNLVGRFWQPGARSTNNEGTYSDATWIQFYAATGKWFITGDLSDGGVAGCPTGAMSVLIQDTRNGQFALARVAENSTKTNGFNLADAGDLNLVSAPFPRLTNRSVAGSTVSYTAVIDPAATGFYSDGSSTRDANITGYQLVQRRRPSATAPNFDATQWTSVGTAVGAAGGSVPVSIDCTAADQVDLGVRLVFDNGGFSSDVVAGRTQVSCDPNMADPDRKFKVIDRKASKAPLTPTK
jgi:hypothetical protein